MSKHCKRSSAYEGKQQLDDLAQAVATLKLSTEQQADKSRKAQAALAQRGDEADKAASSVKRAAEALSRAEDELQAAAEDAGIVWTPLPDGSRSDQITAAVRGPCRGSVTVTYASSAPHWRPSRRRRPNEPGPKTALAVDKSCSKRPKGRGLLEGEAAVELARSQCASGLRAWWTDHSSLFSAVGADTSAVRSSRQRRSPKSADEDAPALSAVLAEHTEAGTETLRERRREAEAEISASHASIAGSQIRALRPSSAEHDDAPPAFHARTDNPQ